MSLCYTYSTCNPSTKGAFFTVRDVTHFFILPSVICFLFRSFCRSIIEIKSFYLFPFCCFVVYYMFSSHGYLNKCSSFFQFRCVRSYVICGTKRTPGTVLLVLRWFILCCFCSSCKTVRCAAHSLIKAAIETTNQLTESTESTALSASRPHRPHRPNHNCISPRKSIFIGMLLFLILYEPLYFSIASIFSPP